MKEISLMELEKEKVNINGMMVVFIKEILLKVI
jgi:hypothetical protein